MPKIKHVVEPTASEVHTIVEHIKAVALKVYPSTTEQDAAFEKAEKEVSDWLRGYTDKVFKLGKKIGAANADAKDMAMYGWDTSVSTTTGVPYSSSPII